MKKSLLLLSLFAVLHAAAQTSLDKTLDSLTAASQSSGLHGVILVAKGDQVLYEKGYGPHR